MAAALTHRLPPLGPKKRRAESVFVSTAEVAGRSGLVATGRSVLVHRSELVHAPRVREVRESAKLQYGRMDSRSDLYI